jgi:hypothetical protein
MSSFRLALSCPVLLLHAACYQPATPCQQLIDGVARHGQATLRVATDPTKLAVALRDPPSPAVWNVSTATADLDQSSQTYRKTMLLAVAAGSKPDDKRTAAVLFAQSTVTALDDIAVVCAGER